MPPIAKCKTATSESPKTEYFNCELNSYTNHDYKSDTNLLSSKKRNNLSNKTYECDICAAVFQKQKQIIKHFRISLCFPENLKNKNNRYNLSNNSENSMLYRNGIKHLGTNGLKFVIKCIICKTVIQNNKVNKKFKCDICSKLKINNVRNKNDDISKKYAWNCVICEESFITLSAFESHRFVHSNNKPIKCNKCNKSFRNVTALEKHKINNLYRCHLCHQQFSDQTSLIVHKRFIDLKNVFQCNICENQSKSSISEHNINNLSKTYECSMCSKVCNKKFEMVTHIYNYHQEVYSNYSCDPCSDISASPQELVLHLEKKLFKCDICPKSFTTNYRLHQHFGWHLGINNFKCQYCPKTYSKYSVYLTHERTHTGETPFRCKHCGKWFPVSSNLNIHLKYKNMFEIHTCNICQKTFSRKSSLLFHKKTHSKEIQLNTNSSNELYNQSLTLKEHGKQHTSFVHSNSLNRHVIQFPNNESHKLNINNIKNQIDNNYVHKEYKCDLCKEKCYTQSQILNHIFINHL